MTNTNNLVFAEIGVYFCAGLLWAVFMRLVAGSAGMSRFNWTYSIFAWPVERHRVFGTSQR